MSEATEYRVYTVRQFVFYDPDDSWSDGYYVHVLSSANREKVLARMQQIQEADGYAEVTETVSTERRIAQSHDVMPDQF